MPKHTIYFLIGLIGHNWTSRSALVTTFQNFVPYGSNYAIIGYIIALGFQLKKYSLKRRRGSVGFLRSLSFAVGPDLENTFV